LPFKLSCFWRVSGMLLVLFGLCVGPVHGTDSLDLLAPVQTKQAYIGGGAYLQSQPYIDADAKVLPTPVVFFDNRLFYVRWARVGMYIYGQQDWGISITAQPNPYGYQASDSPALAGMADRNSSWEGGFSVGGENDLGFAELTWFHDLLDNSNGTKVRLELGKFIKSGRWTVSPSVLAIWLSGDFNNYYYGVRTDEATPSRPAYTAGAGLDWAAQTYLMYDINERWHILGNLRADYLASTITNSPIVDQDWIVSGLISIMYSFPIKNHE